MKVNAEIFEARLDVLSVALQEVMRALLPGQAAQVAEALSARMNAFEDTPLPARINVAMSMEIGPLMSALAAPRLLLNPRKAALS